MKINNLPGNYRPEPIKAPKKDRSGEAEASGTARSIHRDEYVHKETGILPRMFTPAQFGYSDPYEMEGGLELAVGDTGEAEESSRVYRLGDPMPDAGRHASSGTAALLTIDVYRKGFQSSYTALDAAASLWQRENTVIDLKDPSSLKRLQERLRGGNFGLKPTAEELGAYLDGLRQRGLDGEVDEKELARELGTFGDIQPGEFKDSLAYLASRYAAVMDKLERNGSDLTAEGEKLETLCKAAFGSFAEGYAAQLQRGLGLSDAEAGEIKNSIAALLKEQAAAYATAIEQVLRSIEEAFPEDAWLKDHDAFVAARLREAVGDAGETQGMYSVRDLAWAGELAQLYRFEGDWAASGSRNEAELALNLVLVDMETETLIQRGLVSEEAAVLFRSIRTHSQAMVLDAGDRYRAYRESTRLSGEAAGSFPAMDRELWSGIYNAAMDAFRSFGDGAQAIDAGAGYGQAAAAKNMEGFWESFFATPAPRERTELEQQIDELLAEIGQSRSALHSPYQNYLNSWEDFLSSLERPGGSPRAWL